MNHGGGEHTAIGKISVDGGARNLGANGNLGDRGDVAVLLNDVHRRFEQQPKRCRLNAARRRLWRFVNFVPKACHGYKFTLLWPASNPLAKFKLSHYDRAKLKNETAVST